MGEQLYSITILDLALDGSDWSAPHPAATPWERDLDTIGLEAQWASELVLMMQSKEKSLAPARIELLPSSPLLY
jgi:hypothetical protein